MAAFAVVFLLGFWLLRAQSSVLMAEREQQPVRAMALAIGVEPASALALRAASPDVDLATFEQALRRFAELSAQWCEERAAIAIAGDEATARTGAQEEGGPKAAFARRRGEPAALPGVAKGAFRVFEQGYYTPAYAYFYAEAEKKDFDVECWVEVEQAA